MPKATEYLVIREVATDELRVSRVAVGYWPKSMTGYTCGGPYRSKAAAKRAVNSKDENLRRQLYPT